MQPKHRNKSEEYSMYNIRCTVDGPMGYREALLRKDSEVIKFSTWNEANIEANRLTEARADNPRASFTYSAVKAF